MLPAQLTDFPEKSCRESVGPQRIIFFRFGGEVEVKIFPAGPICFPISQVFGTSEQSSSYAEYVPYPDHTLLFLEEAL